MTKEAGILQTWFEARGFGFIHRVVDGEVRSYFAHISQMHGVPKAGATVRFNVGLAGGSGRSKGPIAKNIEILDSAAGLNALAGGTQ
jgi:cold shock CspA family protein